MFQDISAQAHAQAQPTSTPAEEVAELVAQYPSLSEVELARLISLYRQLSALDVALMLSDEKLAPKMDDLFADHRRKIRTPFRQYAVLVAIALVGLVVVLWAMVVMS